MGRVRSLELSCARIQLYQPVITEGCSPSAIRPRRATSSAALARMHDLTRHFMELGFGRARLEHDDVDIAGPQLGPKRLAQEQIEGLRRGVDSVQGQGLTT